MMDEKLINIDPEIMGGMPVFNGTRVPIKTLFEWLETETLEAFLENFPTVSREQAIGILSTAQEMVLNKPDINETTVG
jgi:uncharacterized protein (DUF433 family)